MRRTFAAAAIVFCTLSVSSIHADPISPPGEAVQGTFGEGSSGRGQPNSKTGTMSWFYTFETPAARGGPQANLVLGYDSSSRDREAGYGWGLDIPAIERRPLSGNPCLSAQQCEASGGALANDAISHEKFSFDGQPLVYICEVSADEATNIANCGKEPQPKWALTGGWHYFRPQVEQEFARFYLSANQRYWKVQRKGGELLEFGDRPGSGMVGTEHVLGNRNAIVRWRLVRHSDSAHIINGSPANFVDYRWRELGKRGLLFLTDIFDTPRADGRIDDAGFAHHTQLTWSLPDFPQTAYADPFRATPDLRLSRVSVASMPWAGAGPREIIRTYFVNYYLAQGATSTVSNSQVFQLWHHSFLSEIGMEGRCNQFEDEQGRIATNRECPGPRLPSTTFEYEDGFVNFGVTNWTKLKGGPPNAIQDRKVLPDLKSVGIVDFNRDGLPDIVQGWNSITSECTFTYCGFFGLDCEDLHGTLSISSATNSVVCIPPSPVPAPKTAISVRSTFPLVGYLNSGSAFPYLNLTYQCMDAGDRLDARGLTFYNVGQTPGFFRDGATLVGSWSDGVLAWSKARYAPYRVNPLIKGSTGEFEPGTGCDADNFNATDFHPGWKWQQTESGVDWAKLPLDAAVPSVPRWFADIDGDGTVDRITDSGIRAFDFNVAGIEFTRRFAKGEQLPQGGHGPAQIPFLPDTAVPASLVPSTQSRAETKFYYVDVNGDGLVDLVTQSPNDGGGIPRVRPGDGHGHFWCDNVAQPWPCQNWQTEPSSGYEIVVIGSRVPWPFTNEAFFEDVTGDGLADIVQYDANSAEVRVWVNQDGHAFACLTPSCVAGKVLDPRVAETGGSFGTGDHRIAFADMNADGINDIVILANEGVYVGLFMQKYNPVTGFERGSASRPGLLTRIHNGYGATTDIRYRTIQQLDLAARSTPYAWQYHSPVVEHVVTQIITQDDYDAGGNLADAQIGAPYKFKRTAQYFYQEPAYDRWSNSFAGFRKVVAHFGDEEATTTTTYWFGPCQNNSLTARVDGTTEVPLCSDGSDDDEFKSLSGRIVRIDRSNDFSEVFRRPRQNEPSKHLWTKTIQYSNGTLVVRPDRRVTYAYPSQIDTYVYDETKPVQAGGSITPLAGASVRQTGPSISGGDELQNAPHQAGIRKHLVTAIENDVRGTVKRITNYGALVDDDSIADLPEPVTVTLYSKQTTSPDGPDNSSDTPAVLPCNQNWQCLPDFISVWQPQPITGGSLPDKLLRKSRLIYSSVGDLEAIEGYLLEPSPPLDRHHPNGASFTAPSPSNQASSQGWHRSATANHDPWGNISLITGSTVGGSPSSCTKIEHDDPYQQLPSLVRSFTNGCSGFALVTQNVFDRGFALIEKIVRPNGESKTITFDPFGRPKEIFLPDRNAAPGNPPSILASTLTYVDKKPFSYVDVRKFVQPGISIRSFVLSNGLGEAVFAISQNDSNGWILSDWREKDLTGKIDRIRRPWNLTGTVEAALAANGIQPPADNSAVEFLYDGFGRKVSAKESGVSFSQEVMRYGYFPLAMETRDAEQLKPGGSHAKAFHRIESDGHGRPARHVEHIENPTIDNIITTVQYDVVGEPSAITRSHAGGTYRRTMEFDSLGRLTANKEPNTGSNWRYVWDDAGRLAGTSDARGCGENLHYDGLNRLIGEDFSPCLSSQPAYTPPNLETGAGLESFYRYDAYETDQVNLEPGFNDNARYAAGNLVAIRDRGSHTRFNYDGRDQVRRISRRIAKPDGPLSPEYSPRWYTSRLDYDPGNRPVRRTTGVDIQDLMMNGGSEETYSYNAAGQVSQIASSYGTIIKSRSYDPEGAATRIVYGDHWQTNANFAYDVRHRMSMFQLIAPNATPLPMGNFDYRFADYDDVGNPKTINDFRIAWQPLPPEAAPIETRAMEYDDFYRLTRVLNSYKTRDGVAPWQSPFAAEKAAGNQHPLPMRELPTRIKSQTFKYDGLGNISASDDDLSARFDRSMGNNLNYGLTAQDGPNQLRSGESFEAQHDAAGNLIQLKIRRPGACPGAAATGCAQWLFYDWNEVGQLSRARRWDFNSDVLPSLTPPASLPSGNPNWDVSYAYSQGARVRKSVTDVANKSQHSLEIFDTLRAEQASFAGDDYVVSRDNLHAFLGGVAHVFWDPDGTLPHQAPNSRVSMHLAIGDQLGSTSVVINHATSELVERTTYQPFGALESDYRPAKWKAFRESKKFTGKEEDIEVGLVYFGARYYQPYLGRFISADPLTVHGSSGDLNPYSYVGGRVTALIDPYGLDGCPPDAVCFPDDHITGHRPIEERDDHGEAAAAAAAGKRRQPTFERYIPPTPDRRSYEDNTPIFAFFFPVPSAYRLPPYQRAPEGAPNGLDALRQLQGQSKLGVANFSRDEYPGTDVKTLTFQVVGSITSVAGDVAQIGQASASTAEIVASVCPGGICVCFAAGTRVATPDGLRAIEAIKPGDMVFSRDEVTGQTIEKRVLHAFITPGAKVVEVSIGVGRAEDRIIATPEHPFYVEQQGWLGAGNLKPGMQISTKSGSATVRGVAALKRRLTVYNFEVQDTHTYFVGRFANWVHNSCHAKYNRSSDFGGAATRGTAASAIREAAEGEACPACGKIMKSGTPTQPVPEHSPPLSDVFEGGARSWTDLQRRAYANSPEAFDGALCLGCQKSQGAAQAAKSRQTYSGAKWFVGDD